MRRLLEVRGQTLNSPREVIRAAALESFIDDPEMWFDFLKKRNMTVHTYQEKEAEDVLSVLEIFSAEVKKLVTPQVVKKDLSKFC
jgi:nucleotidyltransferase substrate binding protein (TIGR01987 family)